MSYSAHNYSTRSNSTSSYRIYSARSVLKAILYGCENKVKAKRANPDSNYKNDKGAAEGEEGEVNLLRGCLWLMEQDLLKMNGHEHQEEKRI